MKVPEGTRKTACPQHNSHYIYLCSLTLLLLVNGKILLLTPDQLRNKHAETNQVPRNPGTPDKKPHWAPWPILHTRPAVMCWPPEFCQGIHVLLAPRVRHVEYVGGMDSCWYSEFTLVLDVLVCILAQCV